jgi:3-oxoacyl-[acyl-carrier protein] reductase
MSRNIPNVALVTGGTRGIGLGISKALAGEGWDLAINGQRGPSEIMDVLEELRGLGSRVEYFQGDVGKGSDRTTIVEQTLKQFGRLNLLVNNAGITSPGRQDILDATEDAFDRVMDVNLKGAFFLTQLAAQWMIDQRRADPQFRAAIVNISSISGQFSSLNRGDYCISWACMAQATRVWAARLAEYGISVYEVRPGIISTDMTKPVAEKYDRLIAEGLTAERRWGTPDDVGRAVAVLARGEIKYATGAVLTIDGGLSMLHDLQST